MKNSEKLFALLLRLALVGCSKLCYGVSWQVTPFLQAEQIFSDNITLEGAEDRQSAFVSALNPGVSLFGQSAKSLFNLNYRMQNLYNARGDGGVSVFNQLQANQSLMLIPQRFFINTRGSLSQQNTDNRRIANDNIAGAGGRVDVGTFGITPTWRTRFGNYANGLLQVNFDTLSSGADQSVFSDSINVGQQVFLNSGPEFRRVSWGLSFINTNNFRAADENNVGFQNTNGTVNVFINRQFSLIAQGGHANNSFQAARSLTNGFFYTLGAQWHPSHYYSISAGYGNNRFVTVNLSPNRRLNWVTTFRDNEVGLNTGQTWQTFLAYRKQRSNLVLRHDNDTTTTQAILMQQHSVTVDLNPDPLVNQPVRLLFNIPTLTDEVIERKLWNLSFSYLTGKSIFGVSGFLENRTFLLSPDNNEIVSGVNGFWNWQFAPRTTAFFSPGWQFIDRERGNTTDNRYDVAIGMNRVITNRLTGRLEYRHLNQISGNADNTFQENRATASLFVSF